MKPWYRSKTIGINGLILALAYWFRVASFYVDPFWFVWLIAGANIGLRFVTRDAVGRGHPV